MSQPFSGSLSRCSWLDDTLLASGEFPRGCRTSCGPSPPQHGWRPFVPRSEGPPHPVYAPGRAAHHLGLRGLHLLRMFQAPQPTELQGKGFHGDVGGELVGAVPTLSQPSLWAVLSMFCLNMGKAWVAGCHVWLPSPPPNPPSGQRPQPAAGSLVPASTVIPGGNGRFVPRLLVQGDGFC